MEKDNPRVGIGVYIFQEGKVLLGKRKNAHGSGTWSPPGGHLEFGETPEACAMRELFEETGIMAQSMERGPWTNDYFPLEQKHYITLHMIITDFKGEPKIKEPEKCEQWKWFSVDKLPQNLFLPFANLIEDTELLANN